MNRKRENEPHVRENNPGILKKKCIYKPKQTRIINKSEKKN